MVKVTFTGKGSAHFGGHVFAEAGACVDLDDADPRLGYFGRHPDYKVEGAKAPAKKKTPAKKKKA